MSEPPAWRCWPALAVGTDQRDRGHGQGLVRRSAARRAPSKRRAPALIEKVRSAVTDGTGQYQIIELRPGTYTVTFTLPGFSVVKRENVELTSDFTATINADLKVGAVAETITVSAESPVVDVQNITTRTVMTRDVLDAIPTGRNIQAVGIMIPGTTLALGGGGAARATSAAPAACSSRRCSTAARPTPVQTIEGMRLNNLCAQRRLQRRLLERRQLPGVQLRDGRRLGRNGPGRHPRQHGAEGRRQPFHGVAFGNYTPSSWASDNCGSAGVGLACAGPT